MREDANCALIGLVCPQAFNLPMSACNSFFPLSISFIMFSCVPGGGLPIGVGCKFFCSCYGCFGLDLVEGFGFDLLGDLSVHYSHFLIGNQLKYK